jgi:putative RNA 2'-phosphotransferase
MSDRKLSRQVDSLERLLVYVLGVAPWEFGLLPDDDGWLPLKEVIAAIRGEDGFRGVTEGRIMEIRRKPGDGSPIETGDGVIRLKPGRAEPADRGEEPAKRPKLLHLAIKPTSWPHVSRNGLAARAGEGQTDLRLFEDKEMAFKTTSRIHPDPVLVTVGLKTAEAGGIRLAWRAPGLWSAPELKAEWLSGPPLPPKTEETAKAAKPAETPLPGASFWAEPVAAPKGKKKGKRDDAPEWKTRTRLDRRKDRD